MADENIKEEVVAEENEAMNALETFMEHQRKALTETRKALESLVPVAFREHSTAAFNEAMEGYRSLFNTMIDDINDNVKKVTTRFEKEVDDVAEKVEITEE